MAAQKPSLLTAHRLLFIASLPALPLTVGCYASGGGSDEAGDTTGGETDPGDDGAPMSQSGASMDTGPDPDDGSDGDPPPADSGDDTAGDTADATDDGADDSTGDTAGDESSSGGVVGECGNGEVEGAEVCDDANAVDVDGCTAACEASPELLAYWRFDEADAKGPLADQTGAHDATFMPGDSSILSGVYPDEGRNGSLLITSFESSAASASGPIADGEEGSISVWIRSYTIGNPTRAAVFWQGAAGSDGWGGFASILVGVNANDTLAFQVDTCIIASEDTLFQGDGWFHVVGTWEPGASGTDCTLVVSDGVGAPEIITDNGAPQLPYTAHDTIHIGRTDDDDTPYWFRGYADELMVFDRRLSPTEISDLRDVQAEGGHYD
jgi:cysteine-rich repeat protein